MAGAPITASNATSRPGNGNERPVMGTAASEAVIGGIFLPQGSGVPLLPSPNGTPYGTPPGVTLPAFGSTWWAVSRIATGRFLLSFNNTLANVTFFQATLQLATRQPLDVTVVSINKAAKTIEIDIYNTETGQLVDLSANASNAVHWKMTQRLNSPATVQNV